MAGGVVLGKRDPSKVDKAPAGKVRLFIDEDGQLSAKDESGAVVTPQALITSLEALIATKQDAASAATDAELAAAVATLTAAISAKQDAATAATDAELAAAVASLTTAIAAKQDASSAATDAELASSVSTLNTAIAAKQDASSAATDAELASAVSTLNAAIATKQDSATAATDAELAAAVSSLNAAIAAKQDAATAATDSELAAGLALKVDADDPTLASVSGSRVAVMLSASVDPSITKANLEAFNAKIAPRTLDMSTVFTKWGNEILTSGYMSAQTALGGALMLAWQPAANAAGTESDGTLGFATTGKLDAHFKEQAAIIKAYGKPVLVRLGHEPNGNWYTWGNTKETGEQYKAGFRHIVDLFREEGVTNVAWVWNPNAQTGPTVVDPTPFFPGDDYVDYVALDGYMKATAPDVRWPEDLFEDDLDLLSGLSSKPLGICEFGAAQDVRYDKGEWYERLFALIAKMPRIAFIGQWDRNFSSEEHGKEGDYTIDSSGTNAAALAAFKRGVNSLPLSVSGRAFPGWVPPRPESRSNKDNDTAMAGNSDEKYPSQAAVVGYVAAQFAVQLAKVPVKQEMRLATTTVLPANSYNNDGWGWSDDHRKCQRRPFSRRDGPECRRQGPGQGSDHPEIQRPLRRNAAGR